MRHEARSAEVSAVEPVLTHVPDTGAVADLVVAGCGYSGATIARAWRLAGGRAWGTTREAAHAEVLERAGILACSVDFAADAELPRLADVTTCVGVVSIPPASDGDPHRAAERALRWLVAHGCRRCVYLSSTSVYGDAGGEEVRAATPVAPSSATGERRWQAEQRLQAIAEAEGVALMRLRLPGIYGPGRTVRSRLLSGDYRLVEGGEMYSNRVFVDDIASAVLVLLERGEAGEVYLASDGQPFRVRELVAFACAELGLPLPPSAPLSEVTPRRRDFWTGSKRCDPDRLVALGWRPAYPSFRQGLREAWRREDSGD